MKIARAELLDRSEKVYEMEKVMVSFLIKWVVPHALKEPHFLETRDEMLQ